MKVISALLLVGAVGCATDDATTSKLTAAVGECGPIETHVVGVWDSPTGDVILRVDRPGRHAIVVSAYAATNWRIEAVPGAQVEAIYATGYGKQTVQAPVGARVVTESQAQGGAFACGYALGASTPVCDTDQLLNLVSKRVHEVTSFHGCHTASQFEIGEDLATTSDCGLEASYELDGASQSSAIYNCGGPDSCGGDVLL